ncbi:MAG: right-handed parallel beta-helix repeat-containing protein [Acidobacteriota bacterium]|nr:right-handed parallel beta-helix repeat-containing protein [Acidobacteriota bacterium]
MRKALLASLLLLARLLRADTNVSGTINASTTWTTAGSPYIVTADVTVENNGTLPTLTIQAGVTVKFNSGTKLNIGTNYPGSLQAVGTSGSPITFTANTASPTNGYWAGIRLNANTTSTTITYATVRYGGQNNGNYFGNISITGSNPTIDNVTLQNSNDSGIRVVSGNPTMTNCTLSSNGWGLVAFAGAPSLSTSTLSTNTYGGIYLATPTTLSLQTVTISSNTGYAISQDAKVTLGTVTGLTATSNTTDGIEVRTGTIDTSTTWQNVGLPYIVTGTVTVEKSGSPLPTLTIAAGTTVKFAAATTLQVGLNYPGSLQAVGTSGSPITFTANTGSPSNGYWYGIRLYANTTSTSLTYATIKYGGLANGNYFGNITVTGGSPTLDHLTLQNSNDSGIRITGGSPVLTNSTLSSNGWGVVGMGGTPSVSTSTLSTNTYGGIYLAAPASPSLQTVTISSNTGYAISQDAKVTLGTVTGLTATSNTTDAIEVRAGTIDTITTWQNVGLPYVLTGAVIVEKNGTPVPTLTVAAGNTVKVAAGVYLQVGLNYPGNLQAIGTSGSPITFTANTASPTNGYWYGIRLHSNATNSSLAYVTVKYGGLANGNYYGDLSVLGSSPTIDNVTLQNSNDSGIRITGGSPVLTNCTLTSNGWGLVATGGTPSVSTSTVTTNTYGGIYLAAPAIPSLQTVTITSNTGYAITQDAGTSWGTVSGLTATSNTTNAAEVRASTASTSATWANLGIPYVLTGDVFIEKNGSPTPTLTVAAGVTLKAAANTTLWVGTNYPGNLQVTGTSSAPVTLTANTGSPTAGYWRGLAIGPNTTATQVTYTTIAYAGVASGNNRGGLHVTGGTPSFTNITLQNNAYAGMSAAGGNPTIASSVFTGNTAGIINQTPTTPITARINYWGTTNGPSGSGPGTGQSITTGVLFDPWLTGNPGTPEYLASAAFNNRRFNPTTTNLAAWTIGSSQSSTWTLTISNSQSTVVRTLTGSGTTLAATWDGKNTSGVLQADGTYTYSVQAVAGANTATPASGIAYLDSTLQVAITAPTPTQTVSNVYASGSTAVPVTGTVAMGNLSSWTLEYGTGSTPSTWTSINTGTQAVTNASLGTWQTLALTGLYSVRLSALDTTGDLSQTTITPTVGNFTMSQGTLQFNPSGSQTVTYTSIVPFPLTETITVKNAAGVTVRTLLNAVARSAATYNDAWNGRNDATTLVPDGAYFYTASVTDGTHSMTWDLSSQNVDTYFTYTYPSITSFNPFNNAPLPITYNFPQPGRVTALFAPTGLTGPNCNPPRFCIPLARYEESGPHTIYWGGTDSTGAYRGDAGHLSVFTDRSSFAANAVVAYGTKPTITNLKVTPAFYGPAAGTQRIELDLTTYQNQAVTISIQFLNQTSLSILRTITLSSQPSGHFSTTWDGHADNGMWVAPDFYSVTVFATDSLGNQVQSQIMTTITY